MSTAFQSRESVRSALLLAICWLAVCAPSAILGMTLWADAGGTLACNTGPGVDVLKRAAHRDDSSTDTVYFRFRVTPLSDSETEEYFAGFELYEGDTERLGIGNGFSAYAYSAFFNSSTTNDAAASSAYVDLRSAEHEPATAGQPAEYELPRRGVERTIVFKVQYVPGGDDLITVWIDPDLSVGATEVYQPESLTTRFSANASFNEIRLRHGGRGEGWIFSDMAIATSFADFVDPGGVVSSPESETLFDQQRFEFELWAREPGMPQGVQALAQTADGYLWLAAKDRLARFDGARFVPVRSRMATAGGDVQTLFGDSTGVLWIGTKNKGVIRYSLSDLQDFNSHDGLPSNDVTTIAEEKGGRVWIGTKGGLALWEQGSLKTLPCMENFRGHPITCLCADSKGAVWIGASGLGLWRVDEGSRLSRVSAPSVEAMLQHPQRLLLDKRQRLWVAVEDGILLRMDSEGWKRFRIPAQAGSLAIQALAAQPDGTVWVGLSEGLFQLRGERFFKVNPSPSSSDPGVSCLLVDAEGHAWSGGASGLCLIRLRHSFTLGAAKGLGNAPVGSVTEARPGVVWAVQPGYGILQWEGRSFRFLNVSGVQPQAVLGPMLVTADGTCWIACTNGLVLLRDPQALADESQFFELPGGKITSLASGEEGAILAGTFEGRVWELSKGRWLSRADLQSPISVLLPVEAGQMLAGTAGKGVYLLGASVEAHWDTSKGLANNTVLALHRDAAGSIWIGTEGGLSLLEGLELGNFTTHSGLPSDRILDILEDARGLLWLHDGEGLTWIRKPARNDGAVTVIGSQPLLAPKTQPDAQRTALPVFQKGCQTRSGQLWFAMDSGIVVTEPGAIKVAKAGFPVRVEDVLVNNLATPGFVPATVLPGSRGTPPPESLQIGPGRHRIELQFTAPCFEDPGKLHFRYKMEGLSEGWVEAAGARSAQYTFLPPGDYTFRVAAYGNGTLTEASIGLSVAAYFWQNPWVITGSLAILMGALVGGVRYAENRRVKRRVERLKREHALEQERRRIAQDLHDEMGAGLCRISFLSEHVKSMDGKPRDMGEHISSIATESRQLLDSLDEIVWAVNPQNDTLEHIASYIAQYAGNYFQNTGVVCELDVSSQVPPIPVSSQTRHHCFLAVQEALANALKHSRATRVKLAIACDEALFRITVSDNGKGMEAGAGEASAGTAGNGLLNMRQRMKEIGARCRISSGSSGTTVIFELHLTGKELET